LGGAPSNIEQPEYEMPSRAVADGGRFFAGNERERKALTTLYGNAASVLEG